MSAQQFYLWGYAYLNCIGHEKGFARMDGRWGRPACEHPQPWHRPRGDTGHVFRQIRHRREVRRNWAGNVFSTIDCGNHGWEYHIGYFGRHENDNPDCFPKQRLGPPLTINI